MFHTLNEKFSADVVKIDFKASIGKFEMNYIQEKIQFVELCAFLPLSGKVSTVADKAAVDLSEERFVVNAFLKKHQIAIIWSSVNNIA